ncbi:MAG TPA: SH3 domain-containing protein [Ardenticatenaceae bacterium]|jgi:hypothetical protein
MINVRAIVAGAILLSFAVGFIIGGGPSVVVARVGGDEAGPNPALAQTPGSLFASEAQMVTPEPSGTITETEIPSPEPTVTRTTEPTPTLTSTRTPRPTRTTTSTAEPTLPPTEPPPPTEAPPPTVPPSIAVTVLRNANYRSGPGLGFGVLGSLLADTPATAVARSADGLWVRVQFADRPEPVWVHAQLVRPDGDLSTLPVAE